MAKFSLLSFGLLLCALFAIAIVQGADPSEGNKSGSEAAAAAQDQPLSDDHIDNKTQPGFLNNIIEFVKNFIFEVAYYVSTKYGAISGYVKELFQKLWH